jgi:hypothetical protein
MNKEDIERLRFLLSELTDCESSLHHGDTNRAGNRLRDAIMVLEQILAGSANLTRRE